MPDLEKPPSRAVVGQGGDRAVGIGRLGRQVQGVVGVGHRLPIGVSRTGSGCS